MYLCARGINVASFLSLARSKRTKGQTTTYKSYTENKKTENHNPNEKPGRVSSSHSTSSTLGVTLESVTSREDIQCQTYQLFASVFPWITVKDILFCLCFCVTAANSFYISILYDIILNQTCFIPAIKHGSLTNLLP
jgi:hypothetical protein